VLTVFNLVSFTGFGIYFNIKVRQLPQEQMHADDAWAVDTRGFWEQSCAHDCFARDSTKCQCLEALFPHKEPKVICQQSAVHRQQCEQIWRVPEVIIPAISTTSENRACATKSHEQAGS